MQKEEKRIKPVKIQVQKARKRGCFNFRNFCFCCLGIFLAGAIGFLVLLTLSGLIHVPLLSPLLYGEGPKPSRVVALQPIDDKYFENLFQAAAQNSQSQVVVSENVLSYLINDYFNKEDKVLIPEEERTKGSQIIFEDGYAELFAKPRSPRTALTIKIIPVESGYKAGKIKIGKLWVPVFAANFFFGRFIDFNSVYNSSGIKSIKMEPGQIIIGINPEFFKAENQEVPVPFMPQD